MIDIKLIRENPDFVKANIKKKFQEHKLAMVDEVLNLDKKFRESQLSLDNFRMERNNYSQEIGNLMRQGKKDEAETLKLKVSEINENISKIENCTQDYSEKIKLLMMKIPNIIDDAVPIGKDDSKNVEVQKYGEPTVPNYEIPYHIDLMESLFGIDLDSARRVAR